MTPIPLDLLLRLRSEIPIFRYLSDADVEELAPYFFLQEARAGDTLWHEDDPCDYVGWIISGRLKIKKQTEFPGKWVVLGTYSQGTVVGELCIVDNHRRAVTAEAMEDTRLGVLPRPKFEQLLEEHPRVGILLLKGMLLRVSIRLRKSFDRLADIF
jgi:CRP-like cAMP-binding protein